MKELGDEMRDTDYDSSSDWSPANIMGGFLVILGWEY